MVVWAQFRAGGNDGGRLSFSKGDILAEMFCSLSVMGDLNVLPTSSYKLFAIAVTSVDTRKDFSLAIAFFPHETFIQQS